MKLFLFKDLICKKYIIKIIKIEGIKPFKKNNIGVTIKSIWIIALNISIEAFFKVNLFVFFLEFLFGGKYIKREKISLILVSILFFMLYWKRFSINKFAFNFI